MTSPDTTNTTRSTLTLKLKPAATEQTLTIKQPVVESKRINKSSVQVTIKGRKKEVKDESQNLNKNEVEARFRAVSNSKDSGSEDVDSTKILSKALKDKKQKQDSEELQAQAQQQEEEITETLEQTAPIKPQTRSQNSTLQSDNFDVMNKIKQSIAITNREKEEREKIVSDRKKVEAEKLEKERIEREKRAKPKKVTTTFVTKDFDKEDSLKKGKPNYREERTSHKKLTYIIDGGDSEDYSDISRKRRKQKLRQQQLEQQSKDYKKISREVILPELITVSDLADRMAEKTGDVVKKLFTMGMVATSNQVIDADTAELVITEFGHTVKRVAHSDVENILEQDSPDIEKLPRAPIVTIMGHVDHGKTSLLDAMRSTNVVSGEHGGITQHIGASRIKTNCGKYITFLDTPGHEAFTEMRSRGANVTDIVVLVVAADDGVKEQTIEAINHAKAANVPIIVAVNKIDKPGSDPERVKHELLSHNIISEDLGGDVMFIPVSAKNKLNLDKLEEAILLQAEVLDLKSAYTGKSSGVVIESRIDPAKGVVATILVLQGTLELSHLIVVGTSYGKVRKMSDDNGKNIKCATPSMPVEVLGLNQAPNAGDKFVEVEEERQAREIIAYRSRKEKEDKALKNSVRTFADVFKESGKGGLKYLNIIVKADVNGSVEALQGSILKLNTDEVAIKIIHSATGGITETDISLAAVSNAVIIGFNVRANSSAADLAKLKSVNIRYYSIIYNVVDDLKLLLSGMLEPTQSEEILGKAEIRQVFKISGSGKIAGSMVIDGTMKRNARARILRDNVVVHDGVLKALKRFKDDVKEVKTGFECGISLEDFEDIKEKDIVECYEIVEQKRSL